MKIEIKTPHSCSLKEINYFYQHVLACEEVDEVGLEDRIRNAKLLAFYYIKDNLIGVGAIKKPNQNYKERIFTKAGAPELSKKYHLELGYICIQVNKRGKGVGSKIVKDLLSNCSDKNIFATVRTNNVRMIHINEKFGFKKIGKPYMGRNELIQLFLL